MFDASSARLFDMHIREMGASEGTLWLLDEEGGALVPAHNNGPDAADLIANYRQPLEKGIISSVVVTQRGIAESFVYRNQEHDASVNELLGNVTVHMIAVPLFFTREIRGVISAVRLRAPDEPDPPPFGLDAFEVANGLAAVVGELIEARLNKLAMEESGI